MIAIPEEDLEQENEDEYVEFENEEEVLDIETEDVDFEIDAEVHEETAEKAAEETTEAVNTDDTNSNIVPQKRKIEENLTLDEEIQRNKKKNKSKNNNNNTTKNFNNNNNTNNNKRKKRKKSNQKVIKYKTENVAPKIYVGKVPSSIDETQFKEYWGNFGALKDCVLLPKKKKGKTGHRGCGFVKFEDQEITKSVLTQEHKIEENILDVQRSQPITEKFFISGVNSDAKLEPYKLFFESFGDITDLFITPDRGFGFVTLIKEGKNLQKLQKTKVHQIAGGRHEIKIAGPKKEALFKAGGKKQKSVYTNRGRALMHQQQQHHFHQMQSAHHAHAVAMSQRMQYARNMGMSGSAYGARFNPYAGGQAPMPQRNWGPPRGRGGHSGYYRHPAPSSGAPPRRAPLGSGYPPAARMIQSQMRPSAQVHSHYRGGAHSNVW